MKGSLVMGQQSDVVADLVRRRAQAPQGSDHLDVGLPSVCLPGDEVAPASEAGHLGHAAVEPPYPL